MIASNSHIMDVLYVTIPTLIVLFCGSLLIVCVRQSWRRLHTRMLTSGLIFVVCSLGLLALTLSTAINAILLYRARHPIPGFLYEVDGNKMRLNCTGSGSPAVILEAGGGESGVMWSAVQRSLSMITTTCSYDRAGMGWSSPSSSARDAGSIAQELHALLKNAIIRGPLLLAGASRGGLYIRAFATRYPNEVAALAFVDSSTPLQQNDPIYKAVNRPREVSKWKLLLNEAAFVVGIPRVLGDCSASFPHLTPAESELRSASECHPSFETDEREQRDLEASGRETVRTSFGSTPILVLSHDGSIELRDGMPPALVDVTEKWQKNLAHLSSCSHRVVVLGSGHRISDARPDVVASTIADLVKRLRSKQIRQGYCD